VLDEREFLQRRQVHGAQFVSCGVVDLSGFLPCDRVPLPSSACCAD
jgi:hypothetical protein